MKSKKIAIGLLLAHSFNSINCTSRAQQLTEITQLFHLPSEDTNNILLKLASISNELFSQFIKACQNLADKNIPLTEQYASDALIMDPCHHKVIAENDYARVLWVTQAAGESVPMHSHQWPQVMLIINGSKFIIHTESGNEEEEYEVGVYELEGEDKPYGVTNCGEKDWKALVIELKKTLPSA